MDRVARLPADEREELFHETASARGLTDRIVEKDFWVCWTLKHLFGLEELPSLLFKGGTSLSKAFHAIARFSEDVDLSIDRHALGFDDHELNALSPNQIQKRIKKLQRKCTMLVNDTIRSRLEEDFATVIGPAGVEWQLSPPRTTPTMQRYCSAIPKVSRMSHRCRWMTTMSKR